MLVGNKSDCARSVQIEIVNELAFKNGCSYQEISCLSNSNVKQLFEKVGALVLEKIQNKEIVFEEYEDGESGVKKGMLGEDEQEVEKKVKKCCQ